MCVCVCVCESAHSAHVSVTYPEVRKVGERWCFPRDSAEHQKGRQFWYLRD